MVYDYCRLNFILIYCIKKFQANQDGFRLNGTYQILVNVDGVNVLGENVYNIKKNTEALLVIITGFVYK
jgi:hypothetical protein